MDAQSHVKILRLHCDHLRTLLNQVIRELTTIEQTLATDGKHSSSIVVPHLTKLEKRSAHLAAATVRLRSFLHSLEPQRLDASEADGASPQASLPSADTPQMGRCKIVCTQDGKELAVTLYEKYADLDKRTFPNVRHALPLHHYLNRRAEGMQWDTEPPVYHIVPSRRVSVEGWEGTHNDDVKEGIAHERKCVNSVH